MVYTSLSSKAGNYLYQLNIAHLYGNLMNTYGDNGNILMLKYVAEKLGAHVTVDIVSLHDDFDENPISHSETYKFSHAVYNMKHSYDNHSCDSNIIKA